MIDSLEHAWPTRQMRREAFSELRRERSYIRAIWYVTLFAFACLVVWGEAG